MLNKNVLIFVAVFSAIQVNCTLLDDVEDLLNELRQLTSETLAKSFLQHNEMSNKIDTLALAAKTSGENLIKTCSSPVQQECIDELIECVNTGAADAIDYIYSSSITVGDTVFKLSYEEEKKLVNCGVADESCIDGVISNIKDDIASVPDIIGAALEADENEVTSRIVNMYSCADQAAAKGIDACVPAAVSL